MSSSRPLKARTPYPQTLDSHDLRVIRVVENFDERTSRFANDCKRFIRAIEVVIGMIVAGRIQWFYRRKRIHHFDKHGDSVRAEMPAFKSPCRFGGGSNLLQESVALDRIAQPHAFRIHPDIADQANAFEFQTFFNRTMRAASALIYLAPAEPPEANLQFP